MILKETEESEKAKPRKSLKSRKNSKFLSKQQKDVASKQLAAGWRIVNERLKDIEQLEKKNKS